MTTSTPAAGAAPSPPEPSRYSDTQAMDDIQSLLTSRSRSEGEDAVDEIAEIVLRTGRSMATPRLFRVSQDTGPNGLPRAVIKAGDTVIRAVQNPDTDAINVAIMTITSHDERHLQVDVDGHQVMPRHHAAEEPDTGRTSAGGGTS